MILLLVAICSPYLKSQDTLFLESLKEVNLCKDKRQVIVQLSIGDVAKEDSLFGFDVGIRYDPEKITAIQGLTGGTMAEYADHAQLNPTSEPGLATGFAVLMGMKPYVGSRPLIGFAAKFTGDCDDTTDITIEYLEFTQEFKRKITHYVPARIFSTQANENTIQIDIDLDSVSLTNEDSVEIHVSLISPQDIDIGNFSILIENDISLNYGYILEFDDMDGKILTYAIQNTELGKIVTFIADDFTGGKLFTAKLKSEYVENDYTDILQMSVSLEDKCKCISALLPDSVIVDYKYKDTTTSSVESKIENQFQVNVDLDELMIIAENGKFIESVKVYSVTGDLLLDNKYYSEKKVVFGTDKFNNGFYIIVINNQLTTNFSIIK